MHNIVDRAGVLIGTFSNLDESVDDDERRLVGLSRERRPRREIQMFKRAETPRFVTKVTRLQWFRLRKFESCFF